jgi:GTP pyrophosphokinase
MHIADKIANNISGVSEEDRARIKRAYEIAAKAHEGNTRYSGEPYMCHAERVAEMLAEMGMGPRTIMAALLHDTIEDTPVTADDIEEEFGKEVRFLVEGVTKLGSVRYYGSDRHNESLRKLFVATSQDIRVLIIKLYDRLHNMQTLEHVPLEKRERIARETLEIYVPVAHRLGIGKIRKELEDLAFPYVYPKEYQRVTDIVRPIAKKSEQALDKARKALKKKFVEVGITDFRTFCRVKGLYSLFQKLRRKEWDMDKIYDYLAIRVVVGSVEECYRVLGIIHDAWRPLPKRIKDYIAFPKPNGYQSIHTTVITPAGTILEIQIRTEEMHREAEYGVASHIVYKNVQDGEVVSGEQQGWFASLTPILFRPFSWRGDGKSRQGGTEIESEALLATTSSSKERIPQWIREIGESHRVAEGDKEFVSELQSDFFTNRIFAFTPAGDVIDLPVGATPLDFAYAVHSEIGDHTAGAKVNSKLVGLDSTLRNGDIVEIDTKKSSRPTQKWLEFVKTSLARRHIRGALAEEEKKNSRGKK